MATYESDTTYYEGTTHGATAVANPYRVVSVAADGTVQLASANAGNGIIEDIGDGATGDACSVVKAGVTKCYLAGTTTVDDFLTSSGTAGTGKVAGSGHIKVAGVVSAGVAGELADVYVNIAGDKHSAAP